MLKRIFTFIVAFTLLYSVSWADDRRVDKSVLVIMTLNAEFLWDGVDPEEGQVNFSWKGSQTEAEEHTHPIIHQNEPVGLRGIVTDITEWKHLEEELSKHRKHLQELVKERTTELEKANEQLKQKTEERKQLEKTLRTSEKTKRALLNATFDTVVLIDTQDNVVEINEGGAKEALSIQG